jgi:hypothetical protein
MRRKTGVWLLAFLVGHVVLSLLFIGYPKCISGTWVNRLYTHYLLPGPFFNDQRITTSYTLLIRYRDGGQWGAWFSPALTSFDGFRRTHNPVHHYKNRFHRAMYQQLINRETGLLNMDHKAFPDFQFYIQTLVPADKDSIQLALIRKTAVHGTVTRDTSRYEFHLMLP